MSSRYRKWYEMDGTNEGFPFEGRSLEDTMGFLVVSFIVATFFVSVFARMRPRFGKQAGSVPPVRIVEGALPFIGNLWIAPPTALSKMLLDFCASGTGNVVPLLPRQQRLLGIDSFVQGPIQGPASGKDKMVSVCMPGFPYTVNMLMVFDLSESKRILSSRPHLYRRSKKLQDILRFRFQLEADGLFTAEGKDDWGRMRRLTAASFSHNNVNEMKGIILKWVKKLVARWKDASATKYGGINGNENGLPRSKQLHLGEVDVIVDCNDYTMGIIAEAAFGVDTEEDQVLKKHIRYILQVVGEDIASPQNPILDKYITQSTRAVAWNEATKYVHEKILDTIAETQSKSGQASFSTTAKKTLIERLLRAEDAENHNRMLSKNEIIANAIVFFAAGSDTTMAAISWCVEYFSQYPEVARKCGEEASTSGIDAWLQLPATADDYDESYLPMSGCDISTILDGPLEYCHAVVREVLRLHTPAPFLLLESLEEDEILGRRFASGQHVAVMIQKLARDEDYIPRAAEFLPERWMAGSNENLLPDRESCDFLSHIWFGGGPRVCPGSKLALIEAVFAIAAIASRFDISKDPSRKRAEDSFCFVNRPDEVFVNVREKER